ncbi:MAG: D-glycerate dehydrogenase [Chloroflexi bacterium]|nr:D-glycerate dehydrogenase [Chloroflexota bacterium]
MPDRPRVFVTRNLPGDALGLLRQTCEVAVWPDQLPPSPDDLRREAATTHGLLTLLTDHIDATLLAAAPNLIAVSNMATGYDNIDVADASRRLVLVSRTPGVLTETSADLAFGLLLAAARRIAEGDRYVRAGNWRTWGPEIMLGPDVHGATLGIIGLGRIGAAVARRAAGFGMRVLYHGRSRNTQAEKEVGAAYADLDALLAQSDFVSIHAALTDDTRGLIAARQFGLMKPSAILINTARGPLVDHDALYEALRSGEIAGAALDVTDPEPLPADSPLLALDNVVITPHIASASIATRSEMARLAADNLLTSLAGAVNDNAVNTEIAGDWRAAAAARLHS